MKAKRVWLTGARGQLGNAISRHFSEHEGITWIPTTRDEVDLRHGERIEQFFHLYTPDVIVNAAAFTDVEKAEIDQEEALFLNSEVPSILSKLCKNNNTILMHFSTDHVFGGGDATRTTMYTEEDLPAPVNFYGKSKLAGEREVIKNCSQHYIWRTAWLYSPYGHNFYKSIRRRALGGDSLKVVTDEIGNPTSAIDLARSVVECIRRIGTEEQIPFGLYHYADRGTVSRFEFAREILDMDPATNQTTILPCLQKDYSSRAQRPHFAGLDTSKLEKVLPGATMPWQEALKEVYSIDQRIHTDTE